MADFLCNDIARQPTRVLFALSLSFFFTYTAYLAIQNLQSSLNKDAHLGVYSLSVLYGFIILFGTLSPCFIRLLGAKKVIWFAWLTHIIYTITNFYPTFFTLLPSSALIGILAAPMWTSQGLYISSAGQEYANQRGLVSEKDLHGVLSKFNGIFFMAYEVTQVTGNLVSSAVLSAGIDSNITADQVHHCGANDCPSSDSDTTPSNSTKSPHNEPDKNVIYILFGIFLAFNLLGFLTTVFVLPAHLSSANQPEEDSSSVSDADKRVKKQDCDLMSCFRMAISFKMVPLLPLFMAQAMAIGVLYADYTKSYISCVLGVEWVGYIMACYGGMCAIFALFINHLTRFAGPVTLFIIGILTDMSSLVIMLLWQPTTQSMVGIFLVVPVLSGIAEGIMQSQFNTLIAQLFKDDMPAAFSTYHTSKAASFTITFVISLFVCLRLRLYLAIGLYAVGLMGFLWTELRVKRGHWYHVAHTSDHELEPSSCSDEVKCITGSDDIKSTKNGDMPRIYKGNTEQPYSIEL